MNEKIRIKDIAEKSGVSVGTVDRVLHNRPNVSKEAREKVEQVLNSINYQPNMYASALAYNKRYTFYCIIPKHESEAYWEEIEEGAARACEARRDFHVSVKMMYYRRFDTDTFKDVSDNGGKIQIGKELRWPFITEGDDYGDYYTGTYNSMYVYKKYSYSKPEDLIDRLRCPTDWPLIRYTDVVLQLAEAYVHVGRAGDAVSIVNQIRSRAGMPPVSVGTDEEVMEAIRLGKEQGKGAVALRGKMIDAPIVARAQRTIAMARELGMEIVAEHVEFRTPKASGRLNPALEVIEGENGESDSAGEPEVLYRI